MTNKNQVGSEFLIGALIIMIGVLYRNFKGVYEGYNRGSIRVLRCSGLNN